MSRFRKLSHTLWHCQYHIVWVPKYRYRILKGEIGVEVERCIRAFSERMKCEIVELNVQTDHIHLLVMIPPKISISDFVGTVKGRTAIRVFNQFRHLKDNRIGVITFGQEDIVLIRLDWIQKRYRNISCTRIDINMGIRIEHPILK